MKKFLSLIISAIIISSSILCGCTEKSTHTANIGNNNITASTSKCAFEVLDYKTGKGLTEFTVSDNNTKNTTILLNTVNNVEETTNPPASKPNYIIHLVDKGDSQYDAWINVYIHDNKLYSQYDTKKTNAHGLEINDSISICTDVTPDEFLSILN